MSHSCFTRPLFAALFLSALAFGVAAAPLQLAAQETAPDAKTVSAVVPDAAKPEVAKPEKPSQEEQNEAFLTNGAAVKWIAHTLNVDNKTASNICLFLNFGALVLLVGVPLGKIMPKVLRKRGQTVLANIEEARKATEDANARLSAIEEKLAGLGAEIDHIRSQVESESKQDEVRIKDSVEEEKARIVASASQEINVAAAHARRTLQNFAADLAIEQAAKMLVLTPETDRALIAEFIRSTDATQDGTAKGGQN
jgi:F-type H+-transporting ATPase subunit b